MESRKKIIKTESDNSLSTTASLQFTFKNKKIDEVQNIQDNELDLSDSDEIFIPIPQNPHFLCYYDPSKIATRTSELPKPFTSSILVERHRENVNEIRGYNSHRGEGLPYCEVNSDLKDDHRKVKSKSM